MKEAEDDAFWQQAAAEEDVEANPSVKTPQRAVYGLNPSDTP